MRHALQLAQRAADAGEVPVGAVVVQNGTVVGEGWNQPIGQNDPTAHAEVMALREAARHLGNYRLEGCTLYVTLEPCTMCSGAALHARVAQVVYGASEPKTGAAGSVLNVFDLPSINHQTQILRGVLAEECAAQIAAFFLSRRKAHKAATPHPLKDTALRNPDTAFDGLQDWPWRSHYLSDLPSGHGLRLAYVDEGPRDAQRTWLCVHGWVSWGYAYRHLIPVWLAAGDRVVVLDLPGMGRSDQPKKSKLFSVQWLTQLLCEWVHALQVKRAVLVGQGAGAALGAAVAMQMPDRFLGAWLHDAWPDAHVPAAWQEWLQSAGRKPQWPVGKQMQQAWGMAPAEDAQRAFDVPFAQAGHRAALQAAFGMQADLPPIAEWLQTRSQQQRCWITKAPDSCLQQPLMQEADWRVAWNRVLPCLDSLSHTVLCNPDMDWGARSAANGAKQAVEYFQP